MILVLNTDDFSERVSQHQRDSLIPMPAERHWSHTGRRLHNQKLWTVFKMMNSAFKTMDLVLKMMDFVLKVMDLVLKMMDFVLKVMDLVLKMMSYGSTRRIAGPSRGLFSFRPRAQKRV